MPDDKITQSAKNVDDLLTGDHLHDIIEEISSNKANIKNFVIAWTNEDGETEIRIDGTLSSIFWNLENAKDYLRNL
jgi:hypothetical protein